MVLGGGLGEAIDDWVVSLAMAGCVAARCLIATMSPACWNLAASAASW